MQKCLHQLNLYTCAVQLDCTHSALPSASKLALTYCSVPAARLLKVRTRWIWMDFSRSNWLSDRSLRFLCGIFELTSYLANQLSDTAMCNDLCNTCHSLSMSNEEPDIFYAHSSLFPIVTYNSVVFKKKKSPITIQHWAVTMHINKRTYLTY